MKIRFVPYNELNKRGLRKHWCNCQHCNTTNVMLSGWDWINRLGLPWEENSLRKLEDAINNHKLHEITGDKKKRWQLYSLVCHCKEGVVDIEHWRAVQRAKAILEAGKRQINHE